MNDDDVKEIKAILVGMSGTGKTNIISVLTGHEFKSNDFSTTTSSFVDKFMEVKNKKYRVEIWDTAGQEQFRSLTNIFIKDSKIVIIVYDITNRKSFENIINWHNEIKNNAPEDSVLFLVGNKIDLNKERVITNQEGKKKG